MIDLVGQLPPISLDQPYEQVAENEAEKNTIENQLNYTTHMAISNVVIDTIYEIVGGVVTTPIAGCP